MSDTSHALAIARKYASGGAVDKNPSMAQRKAGNYKMAHTTFQGLPITIENPKGTIRKGIDHTGKPWASEMLDDYGYIKGTNGHDGDHVDVFVGPNKKSDRVFVIDQVHSYGKERFDEHKCMLGYKSKKKAFKIYKKSYGPSYGSRHEAAAITEMSIDSFKEWLKGGGGKKPMAPDVPNYQNGGHVPLPKPDPMKANRAAGLSKLKTEMLRNLGVDVTTSGPYDDSPTVQQHMRDVDVGRSGSWYKDIAVPSVRPYVLPEDQMRLSGGDWASQAPSPQGLADGGEVEDEGESWEPPTEAPAPTPAPAPTAREILTKGKQAQQPIAPIPGQQSLTAYKPTARENFAQWLLGDHPSASRKQLVGRIVGSEGAGTSMGALDFLPGIGQAFQVQEAAQHGDPQQAAMAMMPGVRGPGGSLEREATRLLHGMPAEPTTPTPSLVSPAEAEIERRTKSATEATRNILAEKDPSLSEPLSPIQAPPPKEEPILPGTARIAEQRRAEIGTRFVGKTPEEIRAMTQAQGPAPPAPPPPNLTNIPPESKQFAESAMRGVLGPSLRRGFERTQRPLVEPRGTPDSLIYHRDMGSNYGYSKDDVARYLAHEWARRNDPAYDPRVGNLNENHFVGAFNQLKDETQQYGQAQPMVSHEANIFKLGRLAGDLDSQVAPIRRWAASQEPKLREFINDSVDRHLESLPLVKQIQDQAKTAAQNIRSIESGAGPIDWSIPSVPASKQYIRDKVLEGKNLLDDMMKGFKDKVAADYKGFVGRSKKKGIGAGWSGVESAQESDYVSKAPAYDLFGNPVQKRTSSVRSQLWEDRPPELTGRDPSIKAPTSIPEPTPAEKAYLAQKSQEEAERLRKWRDPNILLGPGGQKRGGRIAPKTRDYTMPLKKGSSKSVVSENIREFHTGPTYAHTKSKFGKAKADKQAIAAALSTARKYGKKKAGGGGINMENMIMRGSSINLHREGMINSSIPGRTDKIPMKVPPGSYVLPADIPSALGQGNTMAGGQILKKMFSSGPYGLPTMQGARGGIRQPRLNLSPQRIPKGMFADGGDTEGGGDDGHVPIIAAGGEFTIHPDVVRDIGHGSIKAGHKVLDKFVLHTRNEYAKTLKKLPGPKT